MASPFAHPAQPPAASPASRLDAQRMNLEAIAKDAVLVRDRLERFLTRTSGHGFANDIAGSTGPQEVPAGSLGGIQLAIVDIERSLVAIVELLNTLDTVG